MEPIFYFIKTLNHSKKQCQTDGTLLLRCTYYHLDLNNGLDNFR